MSDDTLKQIILRLDPEQHEAVKWAARTSGISMNEFIVEAIHFHIERKVKSPAFREALTEHIDSLIAEHETHVASLRRLLGD